MKVARENLTAEDLWNTKILCTTVQNHLAGSFKVLNVATKKIEFML